MVGAQRTLTTTGAIQTSGDMALSAVQGDIAGNDTKNGAKLTQVCGRDTVLAGQATAQDAFKLTTGGDFTVTGSLAGASTVDAVVGGAMTVGGSVLVGSPAAA